MASPKRVKRLATLIVLVIISAIGAYGSSLRPQTLGDSDTSNLAAPAAASQASAALQELPIKGRAPKTGYTRSQFGDGWAIVSGCDMRNRILARDLKDVTYVPTMEPVVCKVASGTLNDPYTGKTIQFVRGEETSDDVQIDHVVALSDAWQKGAQQLTPQQREAFANDPLGLVAVDGPANQAKSDSDAATWLPPNKAYRCAYVARQIAVKKKYNLWVTRPERDAILTILNTCTDQRLPV